MPSRQHWWPTSFVWSWVQCSPLAVCLELSTQTTLPYGWRRWKGGANAPRSAVELLSRRRCGLQTWPMCLRVSGHYWATTVVKHQPQQQQLVLMMRWRAVTTGALVVARQPLQVLWKRHR